MACVLVSLDAESSSVRYISSARRESRLLIYQGLNSLTTVMIGIAVIIISRTVTRLSSSPRLFSGRKSVLHYSVFSSHRNRTFSSDSVTTFPFMVFNRVVVSLIPVPQHPETLLWNSLCRGTRLATENSVVFIVITQN